MKTSDRRKMEQGWNTHASKSSVVEEELFLKSEIESLKKEILDEIKDRYATKEELKEKLDKKDAVNAYAHKEYIKDAFELTNKIFSRTLSSKIINSIGVHRLSSRKLSKLLVNCYHTTITRAIGNYKRYKKVKATRWSLRWEIECLLDDNLIEAERREDRNEYDIHLTDKGKLLLKQKIIS